MLTFRFLKAALALALAGLSIGYAAPAAAQATRTWISGVGDDVNPCSRTAPCKTFQGAISKTAAGGEINCLDPGGFGAVTITKSISLICDTTQAGIVVSGTSAIIINSSTAYVVINGLDLEGLGNSTATAGIHGINVVNAASVTVRNTQIRGFRNGYGINFAPSGPANLVVTDTAITSSGGLLPEGGGIAIAPQGATGSANVSIERATITDNKGIGVEVNTTFNTTTTVNRVLIRNSRVDNNGNGFAAISPAGTAKIQASAVANTFSFNTGYGVLSDGTAAQVWLSGNTVNGNNEGLKRGATGTLVGFGDNVVFGNAASVAPTPSPIAKQ